MCNNSTRPSFISLLFFLQWSFQKRVSIFLVIDTKVCSSSNGLNAHITFSHLVHYIVSSCIFVHSFLTYLENLFRIWIFDFLFTKNNIIVVNFWDFCRIFWIFSRFFNFQGLPRFLGFSKFRRKVCLLTRKLANFKIFDKKAKRTAPSCSVPLKIFKRYPSSYIFKNFLDSRKVCVLTRTLANSENRQKCKNFLLFTMNAPCE